jgi:hypothetical protein
MDRPYGISDFAFPSRWDRESGPDLVERAGRGSRADREQSEIGWGKGSNSSRSRGGFDRPVTIYRGRAREYSLRESEVRTLTDLGRFRVVPEDDLVRFGYQGSRMQMESDIRSLTRQGLVEQHTIEGHTSYSTKILTLTKDGHRLLERAQLVSSRQATYHGLVKPKEARHDADLYRLYQRVAREIERSGGKVRRVVLDFELKKDLYKALSRIRPDKDPRYERISIANQFDLKVVDGKVPISKRWAKGKDGETKTEASDGYVPLHPILATYQRSWREQSLYSKESDFVFPSLRARGRVPLSASVFVADHLRPAAKKAGVSIEDGQRFGLHNLRHSLSNWMVNKTKVEPKTVQGILRHAKIQTTLDLYTQEDDDETLAAQGEYLRALGVATQLVQ